MWWPDFNLVFKLEPYALLRTLYIGTGLFFDSFLFLLFNYKKISVIYVHGFIAALIGLPLSKTFKKKFVVQTHVGFKFGSGGIMNKIIKYVLVNSDSVLVLTKNAKDQLISIGIPNEKITIYHYWVDKHTFVKVKNAKNILKWKNSFYVLFVGRLVDVKGMQTIVSLAKKLKNITFVIAGSGPMATEIERQSLVINNLKYLGKVENQKLPVYYSASDVLLIPSKIIDQTYEEGIPRVMIEALHCGLPVVTTPSGGIPDVFSKDFGLMVDDRINDLENAIIKMQSNKTLNNILSRNTRKYALKYFSIKNAQIIEKNLLA
ncbi:MAG: Glycosyltransferase [Candidatus Woesebacteria bacterium GW2011_GWA1_38_8]|nr:MAG: Glycosyltransferase [Candidatus Woesebacteria bacterium GW2011_GWA1_38_8]